MTYRSFGSDASKRPKQIKSEKTINNLLSQLGLVINREEGHNYHDKCIVLEGVTRSHESQENTAKPFFEMYYF